MKLVLAELQRDLRHRLATYAKTAGSGARLADKRDALLQNCQLWRLLQVSTAAQTDPWFFLYAVLTWLLFL